jgi:3,4-dihydroxy 2-butanone 4-phosphate synthase/GTP cyclohydrolase II
MHLARWLELNRIRRYQFAKTVGVSAGYITTLCSGENWPSREVVLRISAATDGEVTANDFVHPLQDAGQ